MPMETFCNKPDEIMRKCLNVDIEEEGFCGTLVVRSCSVGSVSLRARRPCWTSSFRLPVNIPPIQQGSVFNPPASIQTLKQRTKPYSLGTCPWSAPNRYVQTGSVLRWTWLCSQSSLPRGKSERCEVPCPAGWTEQRKQLSTWDASSLCWSKADLNRSSSHRSRQWGARLHRASFRTAVWESGFL